MICEKKVMARGEDLQERLINFAVTVINLCTKLPKNQVGSHIAGQLLRSGTSPAPNYAEARGAESKKDFLHKLRITSKELNETGVWLAILGKTDLIAEKLTKSVSDECDELSRIIGASIKTAKRTKIC
jgi:four helix bundle protein